MFDNEQKIWAAISSVMNGTPSTEEKELIDSWINENESNRKFFEIATQNSGGNVVLSDDVKERIYSKVESSVLPSKNSRRLNFRRLSVAASIAVLVSLSIFSLVINIQSKDEIVSLESTTPYGVKTKLTLSDSTTVFLNAGATLKYPAKFKGKTREVFLKGEAYFEVKKDTEHPFIVTTSNVNIKVLGTHFNVKSFPEEDIFETTLLEGAVALYTNLRPKNEVRLKPDQKASYSERTGEIVLQKSNAELEASWIDGKFYFDNELLPSIVKDLERSYNVPVKICSQELNDDAYSGFFDKNRTIYQALDVMKYNRDFYYETSNDTILIFSKSK